MVAIIDYDAGNVMSVLRACEAVGADARITSDADMLSQASHVILPGQGAFGDAMEHIRDAGLIEPVRDVIFSGKPFLGICLGLQVLFSDSEESPGVEGLSILPGHIRRIFAGNSSDGSALRIPHIGWNSVELTGAGRLFSGISGGAFFYFDHSFFLSADKRDIVCATCDYGVSMDVSVEYDNIFACQFHPEKSSDVGLRVLKNFVSL